MSLLDLFNSPSANTTGNVANLQGGKQRSFFLQPDILASSLTTRLASNLNIKGQSKSTDANGNKYPIGFTPDVDFYVNKDNIDPNSGSPIERGVIDSAGVIDANGNQQYGSPRDTNDILDQDVPNAYDAFDEGSNYEYLHRLDRGQIPVGLKLTKDSDIYLSSFVETSTDNEDPVSFGYDIIIDYDNSPLFNGAIEDFLSTFSTYSELSSRIDILTKFKAQFFKFFEISAQNLLNLSQPRTYYLQKISGLGNLSESISSDKSKQFVDYGKDFVTLTLREDVSINTGYLAVLYKLLTWSRVHGKKMIPDNLLRFDVEIVVTEARKFNRVYKNSDNTLDQYADLMSRYKYNLYECQFFFEKLSHDTDIDMTKLDYTDGFDIKFNYKYTTLRFEKFTENASIVVGNSITRDHVAVDNSVIDLSQVDPKNSDSFTIVNNSIVLDPVSYVLNKYTPVGETSTYNPIGLDQVLVPVTSGNPIDVLNSSSATTNQFQNKLNNMNVPSFINTITNQSNLLQQTLQNIESTFNADLSRAIYTITSGIEDLIPSPSVGGFSDDGYQYNLPAYYINRAFNAANNTLQKSLGL